MAAMLRSLRTLRSLHRISAPERPLVQPVTGLQELAWKTWVRGLLLSSAVCAGHNKWSKVKHIKGPKDEARSKLFAKLAMLVKLAVKEGGPNPEFNANLAQALEQCRSNNMPKASIETAIKQAEKSKPVLDLMFEVRGPGGCLLLIQVLTDAVCRTRKDIKGALIKNGGAHSDGVRHNFVKQGIVVVQGLNISMERALELAIEAGAEDVLETTDEEDQPLLQYICDAADLLKVRASLESLGLKVNSSGLNYVPRVLLQLDQQQLDAASKLVEALNDCEDVVQIWDNIHVDS